MNLMMLINSILVIVGVLLAVAFFSLFERKLLSSVQFRLGPNKVGLMGNFQPFSDAMKLISKIDDLPNLCSIYFFLCPMMFFSLSLIMWVTVPMNQINFPSSLLFVMFIFSITVYPLIFLSWVSNSKYSKLGAFRTIAQSLSYEIILSMVLLSIIILSSSTNLTDCDNYQSMTWYFLNNMIMSVLMIITLLMESNRSPFDMSESESELVSGLFIELGGMSYVFIFLAENTFLLFSCYLFSLTSLGSMSITKLALSVFFVVLIRSAYPRIRYDKLMKLCWIQIMPVTISLLGLTLLMS